MPSYSFTLTSPAAATPVTSSTPSAPFGFGADLWCESDLDPRMIEVSTEDSALVLAQHVVRRLDTPNGLPDDDDWGLSLADYCNRPTTRKELYELEGTIAAELVDDDRIAEVEAQVEPSSDCSTLTVTLRIVPMDPLADDFSLTLSVSDAGVLLEEIRA